MYYFHCKFLSTTVKLWYKTKIKLYEKSSKLKNSEGKDEPKELVKSDIFIV